MCKKCMRMAILAVIMVVFPLLALHSQSTIRKTVQADGPRPLAKAAREFGRQYGIIITYEDPVYSVENDYGSQEPVPGSKNRRTAFFPRRGQVEAQYEVSSQTLRPLDPVSVLQRLAKDHAERGNPGEFRVEEREGVVQIIPTAVVDKRGNVKSIQPVLDTRISMQLVDRSLYDTVDGMCQMISKAIGIRVAVGSTPTNLFLQQHVAIGAVNERARDVLLRIMKVAGKSLTWTGFAGASGDYILSFEVAVVQVENIRGGKVNKEIPLPERLKK